MPLPCYLKQAGEGAAGKEMDLRGRLVWSALNQSFLELSHSVEGLVASESS